VVGKAIYVYNNGDIIIGANDDLVRAHGFSTRFATNRIVWQSHCRGKKCGVWQQAVKG
jgi:hypothetical protein